MYHKPADPITFLEECLVKARNSKDSTYDWDTFHKGDREDNLSLASSKINNKDLSPAEDGPRTVNNSDEEKMKTVKGKTILFVLGECEESFVCVQNSTLAYYAGSSYNPTDSHCM